MAAGSRAAGSRVVVIVAAEGRTLGGVEAAAPSGCPSLEAVHCCCYCCGLELAFVIATWAVVVAGGAAAAAVGKWAGRFDGEVGLVGGGGAESRRERGSVVRRERARRRKRWIRRIAWRGRIRRDRSLGREEFAGRGY